MKNRNNDIVWERIFRQRVYEDLMEVMRGSGLNVLQHSDRQFIAHRLELLERFLDELITDTAIPFTPLDKINRGVAYEFTALAERYF